MRDLDASSLAVRTGKGARSAKSCGTALLSAAFTRDVAESELAGWGEMIRTFALPIRPRASVLAYLLKAARVRVRERATHPFSEDEGVRAAWRKGFAKQPPHPTVCVAAPSGLLPRGGRQSHMAWMMPLARRRRICPLPSRERATRWFSEDEWVRGPLREKFSEANPSPNGARCTTEPPSPARGEGKFGTAEHAAPSANAIALPLAGIGRHGAGFARRQAWPPGRRRISRAALAEPTFEAAVNRSGWGDRAISAETRSTGS